MTTNGVVSKENTSEYIGRRLIDASMAHLDRTALLCEGKDVSYREFLHDVELLSLKLEGLQLASNRVLLAMPNSYELIVAIAACIVTQKVVIQVDIGLKGDALLTILTDSTPGLMLVTKALSSSYQKLIQEGSVSSKLMDIEELQDVLSGQHKHDQPTPGKLYEMASRGSSNDQVTISYTSGSTGLPKGVMHSHASWLNSIQFTIDVLGLSSTTRLSIPFPFHHAYSFRHLLACLLAGGTVLVSNDFISGLKVMKSEKPTALLLVPAALKLLLEKFSDLLESLIETVEVISIGTAYLSDDLLQQLIKTFPQSKIFLPYGLTEVRVGFLSHTLPRTLMETAPDLEITLIGEQGKICTQAGERGDICIRGPGVMLGYWNQEHTPFQSEGFLTGDIGLLSESSHIILEGRSDDMLNVGGRKVSPYEIEGLLSRHPGIEDCAVISYENKNEGIPHEVIAFLVSSSYPGDNEIRNFLRAELEPYKIPNRYILLKKLPRTNSGKIQRAELQKLGK